MNRIQELRKQANLSQVELAKILHVKQASVSQWETERTNPDFNSLILLADYFNVSVDYIIGRSNTPNNKYHPPRNDLPEYERLLLDRFRKASPELQQLALAALGQFQAEQKMNKAKT